MLAKTQADGVTPGRVHDTTNMQQILEGGGRHYANDIWGPLN